MTGPAHKTKHRQNKRLLHNLSHWIPLKLCHLLCQIFHSAVDITIVQFTADTIPVLLTILQWIFVKTPFHRKMSRQFSRKCCKYWANITRTMKRIGKNYRNLLLEFNKAIWNYVNLLINILSSDRPVAYLMTSSVVVTRTCLQHLWNCCLWWTVSSSFIIW